MNKAKTARVMNSKVLKIFELDPDLSKEGNFLSCCDESWHSPTSPTHDEAL